jgi:hypothetical protein
MNLLARWYELVGLFRIWRDRLFGRRAKTDPRSKKDGKEGKK